MRKTAIKALIDALRHERMYLRICERTILSTSGNRQKGARTSARFARLRISDLESAITVLHESSGA